jgi:hemolysin activation/secretion protein
MDLRYYKMILFKNVFAFKLSGGYSNNDPSFPFMYKLGGSDKLRGYSFGRFVGSEYYALQGEIRRRLDKVISMAIFLDAGDVAYPEFRSIKSTYGFGFRFGLPPDYLMKVRVDFGITKDQKGLFVTFGEAF